MASRNAAGTEVADGLLSRRAKATVPPAVWYGATQLGLSLDQPLAMLRDWTETHMAEINNHRTAGGP